MQTLFLGRTNLNLSLTKLAVHIIFKRLASLEAGSRGNTLVPLIVTSDSRVHWSTLIKEMDRVNNIVLIENSAMPKLLRPIPAMDKENTSDLMNIGT